MQHLKYTLFALVISGLFFLGACDDGGDDPDPQTVAEKISVSWRIQSASQDVGSGSEAVAFPTDDFRVTFRTENGETTTYSVTPGGVPAGAKPNFNGTTDEGTWSISGNTNTGSIVFEDAAADNSTVAYTYNEDAGTLTLTWTVPQGTDKTEPTYTFVLEQV